MSGFSIMLHNMCWNSRFFFLAKKIRRQVLRVVYCEYNHPILNAILYFELNVPVFDEPEFKVPNRILYSWVVRQSMSREYGNGKHYPEGKELISIYGDNFFVEINS